MYWWGIPFCVPHKNTGLLERTIGTWHVRGKDQDVWMVFCSGSWRAKGCWIWLSQHRWQCIAPYTKELPMPTADRSTVCGSWVPKNGNWEATDVRDGEASHNRGMRTNRNSFFTSWCEILWSYWVYSHGNVLVQFRSWWSRVQDHAEGTGIKLTLCLLTTLNLWV